MRIDISKKVYEKLKAKSPWIYLSDFKYVPKLQGEIVNLYYNNTFVTKGFFNHLSKIAFRVLSYENIEINREFFKERVKSSILKRDFTNTNSYRLIHSEADFLPGLIVDRYGENLICSFTSAGMDRFKDEIVSILFELLEPKGIYEKGDRVRLKEGLEIVDRELYGKIDEEFIIKENGKEFFTNLKESQKTGFFLDQRVNRKSVAKYGGKRVLDLFANAGGFGIYAKGDFTKFVEISEFACSQIEKNCTLNGLKNYEIVQEDVFKFLEKENSKYDLIIIDPPAFAKSKSAKKGALKGWKYLIVNSLKLLNEGGYIALFSCSHAINQNDLLDLALSSSIIDNSYLEVIEFLKQDLDHPYILNIPNSLYLTGVVLRKLSR